MRNDVSHEETVKEKAMQLLEKAKNIEENIDNNNNTNNNNNNNKWSIHW